MGQPLEQSSSVLVEFCQDEQWSCTPNEGQSCASKCADYFTEPAQAHNGSELEVDDAMGGCDETKGYATLCPYDPQRFVETGDYPIFFNVSNTNYYQCIQCMQCKAGWHLRGDGSGVCDKCPESASENVMRIAGMSLLTVLIVGVLIFSTLQAKGKLKQSDAVKRIMLGYLQILTFAKGFNVQWPKPLAGMFEASGTVAEAHTSAISVDCAFTQGGASLNARISMIQAGTAPLPIAIQKNIFLACMIPTAIIFVLLFWTIDFACITFSKKRKDSHQHSLARTTTTEADTNPTLTSRKKVLNTDDSHDRNESGAGAEPAGKSVPRSDGESNNENSTDDKNSGEDDKKSFRMKWMKARAQIEVMTLDHFTIADKTISSLVTIVFLIYPSTVKESLKMLACHRITHPGDENANYDLYRSFLKVDYQLECYSPLHLSTLSLLTLPVTIVITFGVPAVMACIIQRSEDLMKSRRGRLRYMLLTTGYRPNFHWWESVTLCRKALIAAVSVFYASEDDFEVQIFLGTGLCAGFLALHLYFAPYAALKKSHSVTKETVEINLTHNLETVALTLSLCTLYLGQVFTLRFGRDGTSDAVHIVMTILIMTSNVAFFLLATKHYFELKLHENPALEKRWIKLRRRFACCHKQDGRSTSPSTKVAVVPQTDATAEERSARAELSWSKPDSASSKS